MCSGRPCHLSDSFRYMVTCTAIALGILLHASQEVFAKNGVAFEINELVPLTNCLSHSPLVLHSELFENFAGRVVSGEMRGENTIEFQLLKAIANNRPGRLCGVAVAPKWYANPVT